MLDANIVRTAIAIAAGASALGAQGDVFSSNSGGASCGALKQSAAKLHSENTAELSEQKADIDNSHSKQRTACGGEPACVQRARREYQEAVKVHLARTADEDARHKKALIDIRTKCAGAVDSGRWNVSTFSLDDIAKFFLEKILPDPSNPTPVNGETISKMIFLKNAPGIRDWLSAQLEQAYNRVEALKAKAKLNPVEQADLQFNIGYFNNLRAALRQLRLTYKEVRDGLGPAGAAFPDVRELNIPY